MPSPDVVIAGAGIIGLSAALALTERGLGVLVIEQGQAMREASWAAAGMLAAHDPENPPALRALAALSLALYPQFLATIERLSGVPVPLRTAGTLQAFGGGPGALSPAALRQQVPNLEPGHRSFQWLEEQSLDPRDICTALPRAAQRAGVTIRERVALRGVTRGATGLRIETSDGVLQAQHFVQCCGAWSPVRGVPLPVEPRKGQMLAVTMPVHAPTLSCVLRTSELYLVPRGPLAEGHRIIVGATVERAGFDRSVTDTATAWLLAAAAELWPPITLGKVTDELTDRWTGLRPAAPDGLPILDSLALPEDDPAAKTVGPGPRGYHAASLPAPAPASRAWVATGHFRNGILLAPGTARLLSQLVLGEDPEVDLTPFRLNRFSAVASGSRPYALPEA